MELRVTEGSDGKQIDLSVGQQFTIVLPENPTTGYVWHFVKNGQPTCVLIHDSFRASSHQVGSPGMHEWQFRAAASGRVTLEMELARGWERETKQRSFLLIVKVI